ncbi:hypothetical protein V8C86DRAFT_473992 [Haematococcus lacustris]
MGFEWIFNPTVSTCSTTNSFPCRAARDYTYQLQAFYASRVITIDTSVDGVAAWDTILFVLPVATSACAQCSSALSNDDDGTEFRSRLTFTAAAGVAYLVVVEGWWVSDCGMPSIRVSSGSGSVAPPPPIANYGDGDYGTCTYPHFIDIGDIGSRVIVPSVDTCWRPSSCRCHFYDGDYVYLLPASSVVRTITVDTCVAGVAAWDTTIIVFPARSGVCSTCPWNEWNNDGSSCGGGRSRLTFNARPWKDYLVVVENPYWSYDVGSLTLRILQHEQSRSPCY